jgi:excisionase family DNA binding protein
MPTSRSSRRIPARLTSITDGAEYANVCRRTVYNWIKEGRITGYRAGPKLIKVDLDELDKLIKPIPAGR